MPSGLKLGGGLGQNRIAPLSVLFENRVTPAVDSLFSKSIAGGNFTLAVDAVASGITTLVYDFTASPGHGLVATDELLLLDTDADRSFQAIVMSVAGDVITVDRPIDHAFSAAGTLGRTITTNMAVDGSATEQIFTVRAGQTPRDITRFIVTMLSSSSMDDGLFGDLPALARGFVLRIIDGYQETIFNFKKNLDIKQFCYDVNYSARAPAGQTGLVARITFAGPDKHGIGLRIAGTDAIQWVVQDDLTGLNELKVAAEGHVVS